MDTELNEQNPLHFGQNFDSVVFTLNVCAGRNHGGVCPPESAAAGQQHDSGAGATQRKTNIHFSAAARELWRR